MSRCIVHGTRYCPDPKLISDPKDRARSMTQHAGCPPRNWGNPKLPGEDPYPGILAGYDRKHGADIDAYQANLEQRILQLEAELNQPKHRRWQAPINRETP